MVICPKGIWYSVHNVVDDLYIISTADTYNLVLLIREQRSEPTHAIFKVV